MRKKKNNIVLIGFMGCGKSSVGKRIAQNFDYKFVDTDLEIQSISGMTINDIFAKYGEDYFRKLERNYCKLCAINDRYIIATGGGVIKNDENVRNLKINGSVVYLKCGAEKIYKNIKNDTTRPLLNGAEDKLLRISSLLLEREPLYERHADFTIDITEMRLEESAWQVGRELRRLGFL
ncbi:MAG: shikimate kinase [Clostridiales bacterium]|nr:shikimate kinase [Clostridiales bacterium]